MRPRTLSMLLRSWRDSLSIWWTDIFLPRFGLFDDGFARTPVRMRKPGGNLLIDIRTGLAFRRRPWATVRRIGSPRLGVDIILSEPLRLRRCWGGQGLEEAEIAEALKFVEMNRELMLEFWRSLSEIDSVELMERLKYLPEEGRDEDG